MYSDPFEPQTDRAQIAKVVATFYDAIRADTMLGPIFSDRIRDWPTHLELMQRFWASVMLRSGEYKGAPHAVHLAIPGLTESHYARWLTLFGATVDQICTADVALAFKQRATRITQSFLAARPVRSI